VASETTVGQIGSENNFRIDNSYPGSVLHAEFRHTLAEVAPLHGIRA
jgi:hypothetical protein